MSQQLSGGLSVYAAKHFLIVHEVDVEGRVPLLRLFQDDAQRRYLVSAGSILAKASLLISELGVDSILHLVQ